MILLVCGSRRWGIVPSHTPTRSDVQWAAAERARTYREIALLAPRHLIHGAAPGADTCSAEAALEWSLAEGRAIIIEPFPADWQRDGRAAGPIRNARMLADGKPERGLAFGALWRPLFAPRRGHGGAIRDEQTGWKHTGTGDMVKRLLAARLPVRWVARAEAEAVELVGMPAVPAGDRDIKPANVFLDKQGGAYPALRPPPDFGEGGPIPVGPRLTTLPRGRRLLP